MKQLSILIIMAAVAGGCVSPVIPLPPPIYELEIDYTTQSVMAKNKKPEGDSAYANKLVYFYNIMSGEGVITTADGSGKYRTAPVKFNDLFPPLPPVYRHTRNHNDLQTSLYTG